MIEKEEETVYDQIGKSFVKMRLPVSYHPLYCNH